MRRPAILALALLALVPAVGSAATPRASYSDVEDEVMCVTCNVPLGLAESPQADRQKAELRRLVGAGLTKQQIKDRLVAEYGANVLALPKGDGIGAAAYIVPIAAGVAIVGLLLLLLPRWRRRPRTPTATDGESLSPADMRRLDDDLARFDP